MNRGACHERNFERGRPRGSGDEPPWNPAHAERFLQTPLDRDEPGSTCLLASSECRPRWRGDEPYPRKLARNLVTQTPPTWG